MNFFMMKQGWTGGLSGWKHGRGYSEGKQTASGAWSRTGAIAFLGAEVVFGEELGGDPEGDFVRVVGGEIEAGGAVEFFRERGREAVSHERAVENGRAARWS
jgi:hypothetical protein